MIFVHRGDSSVVTSSVTLMGPETYDNLGNETYLTNNRLPKGTGKEHLVDSNISDDGTKVTITNGLDVTGALSASTITGFGNVTTHSSSVDSRIITNLNSAAGAFASASAYSASVKLVTDTFATSASLATARATDISTISSSVKTITDSISGRVTTIEGKTLVSGSSQVTLSSTTGYGSVLNQAVLTSSSPSFVGLSLSGNLLLNNGGYGWIYATDTNHSIIMRGDRAGAVGDWTTYYQYGGNISAGKGHKFYTGGVLANQTLKFHIADDYTYNTGNMTIGGTLTENSSIRYKDNVETIKYGLDKVLQMRGVSYTKKDTGIKEIGLIAEELNEIIPDLVIKNEEGLCDSVSYGRITAILIEAIKEQQKQIEELKALIK
jgi:hypothetical protein